jgi:hypothetical protein
LCAFLFSHVCYMPNPSHFPWLHRSDYIWLLGKLSLSIVRTVLSRVWVTIDWVWIGDSIYWPLVHTCTHDS